ncbi:MAG TPA: nitrite/sulfite reductase [Bryobacteraceae bacterium]|jgi:sulfite reductase beta subunit-like hemoprotein
MTHQVDRHTVESDYDAVVRADIEAFRAASQQYTRGELTDDQFRPHRLRRGIYTQRQAGVHMIRTKIPGGIATARQFRIMAELADRFAGSKGHLTTRQNMQFHFVPLKDVPDALHLLADTRLTTREACYNTIRNITACPYTGLVNGEPFDVNPYAQRAAFAFLHQPIADNLPRKFKIGFAGTDADSIATSINDLGFRAVIRDGKRGFRVTVGGGLGPLPNEAKLLDEFLPDDRVVNRIESVVRVFGKYGNRGNKNKARLKFVLRERGFEWLRDAIDLEYQDILKNGGVASPEIVPEGFGGFESNRQIPVSLPPVIDHRVAEPGFDEWFETEVEEQKQLGYAIATVRVDQGNLTSTQMRGVADAAEEFGDGALRVTMTQNLLIAYVPLANLKRLHAKLKAIGLAGVRAHQIDDVMTCPGAYSCNLALTKSMNLGEALSEALVKETDPEVRKLAVHVSGCPNSCGQHWTGDFGFYGNARKIDGREVPYYLMLLGGGMDDTGIMRFGLQIQSLPARLVPVAVDRVIRHFQANHSDGETFREYVLRHKVETFRKLTADLAKPAELFPEIYQDWGDEQQYSLQLGRGECAA